MREMALWNVSGFYGCDSKLGHTVAVTDPPPSHWLQVHNPLLKF
jgi:hypothetical protein